jgi:hypothetical protein
MIEIRDSFLSASQENFMEIAHKAYFDDFANRTLIGKEIALLHNQKRLDVLSAFKRLRRKDKEINFFIVRKIFEDALPDMNADVVSVMDCIIHLSIETEGDLSVGTLYNAFEKFCEINPKRPERALKKALELKQRYTEFIPCAIIAGTKFSLGKYLDHAIDLSEHFDSDVKTKAIFSIGRIDYKNDKRLIVKAFEAIKRTVQSDSEDYLFAVALKAAFSLHAIGPNIEKTQIIEFFRLASRNRGDSVNNAMSEIFGFEKLISPSALLDVFLDVLKDTNIQNDATLDNIGIGIEKLMKNNQEKKAISFLEKLLCNNEGKLSVKKFCNLTNYLRSAGLATLGKLATRWFLQGTPFLGEAIMDIILENYAHDIILTADAKLISGKNAARCLFITRKTIGWLFYSPITAVSFILSIINFASDKDLDAIVELLFNPLLVNNSNKIREYIDKEISNLSPQIQTSMRKMLKRLDEYHKGLKEAQILELRPSLAQRETYSRLFDQKINKACKDAQKNSFISMFPQSLLLYGKTAINYHSMGGATTRTVTPLQSHEHFIDISTLQYIDPHGLDFKLRVFRNEKRK